MLFLYLQMFLYFRNCKRMKLECYFYTYFYNCRGAWFLRIGKCPFTSITAYVHAFFFFCGNCAFTYISADVQVISILANTCTCYFCIGECAITSVTSHVQVISILANTRACYFYIGECAFTSTTVRACYPKMVNVQVILKWWMCINSKLENVHVILK